MKNQKITQKPLIARIICIIIVAAMFLFVFADIIISATKPVKTVSVQNNMGTAGVAETLFLIQDSVAKCTPTIELSNIPVVSASALEDVDTDEDIASSDIVSSEEENTITVEKFEVSDKVDIYTGNNGFELSDIPLDQHIQEYIYDLCQVNEIDYSLVLAVIKHESDFNADLISSTDDYGLMQINKCNHGWLRDELGDIDFLDPVDNVRCGVYILKQLLDKYDTEKALMAYNMGISGAKKLWDQGITSSKYSRGVLNDQVEIKKLLP